MRGEVLKVCTVGTLTDGCVGMSFSNGDMGVRETVSTYGRQC